MNDYDLSRGCPAAVRCNDRPELCPPACQRAEQNERARLFLEATNELQARLHFAETERNAIAATLGQVSAIVDGWHGTDRDLWRELRCLLEGRSA